VVVTESPSDAAPAAERDVRASETARRVGALVGSDSVSSGFGTAKVTVPRERWVEAHLAVKEAFPFFSWLAGVDWSAEVEVGEPPEASEAGDRFEVMSRVADVAAGDAVILSTSLPKDDPVLDTLVSVYGGADWHEREAAEMFGIRFAGHPNLVKLYLPDSFEGHPMLKSYPLLSREVKPWPGTVDVEDVPSTENPET
jgi:NADH-quinone oxidoreductase subunit C